MERVFVYGSLRKSCHNHEYLESAKFIGTFKTLSKYTMLREIDCDYPCVVYPLDSSTYINGEIYEVDNITLKKLDKLEGHPNKYIRIIDSFTNGNSILFANIYIMQNIPKKYKIIEGGNWLEYKN